MSKDLTAPGEIHALLGRGTEYEGKLTFEGRVRIDGTFRGHVFSDGLLIVGEGAEIDAEVDVGTLIVLGGTLRGRVRARQLVELHASCRVHADLQTPQLFVARGAVFDGGCTMEGEREVERHPLGDSVERALESTMDSELSDDPESRVDAPEAERAGQPEVSEHAEGLGEAESTTH